MSLFTGCIFVPSPISTEMNHSNWGSFAEAKIPVKDFESKGLVFAEYQFIVTDKGTIEGETFMYQKLLKEAERLGADAIINVAIDKRTENITQKSGFGTKSNKQQTWYGSALAIKYTDALVTEAEVSGTRWITINGGASTSTSTQ